MASNDAGGVTTALLSGLILGAIAGLLFAPKSGAEAREDITDWLKARREKAEEAFSESR